jgi:hypothetical protein
MSCAPNAFNFPPFSFLSLQTSLQIIQKKNISLPSFEHPPTDCVRTCELLLINARDIFHPLPFTDLLPVAPGGGVWAVTHRSTTGTTIGA